MLRHDSHLCIIWMLLVCCTAPRQQQHTNPTCSEDNCRDEHGRIDLVMERMVMSEIGLNVLLDYCWNGTQVNTQQVSVVTFTKPQMSRAR